MLQPSNRTIVGARTEKSWSERLEDASRRFAGMADGLSRTRVLFLVDNPTEALEALIFAQANDLDAGVMEAERSSAEMEAVLDRLGVSRAHVGTAALVECAGRRDRISGRVTVLSSGTTGVPKMIEHRWDTLNTLARARQPPPQRWYVPYQIGSYAWYQMMCLGLFSPEQHLHCGGETDPISDLVQSFRAGATAISATPTYWRYAFLNLSEKTLRSGKLQSISLGGEIVDQPILDQIKAFYPEATVRHIYASSEAGAAIVVSDGRAGFPAAMLEKSRPDLAIKIENGRLYVRSRYSTLAAAGHAEAWVDTGDLVELRGDRVHFVGREQSLLVNVGGLKAFPAEIEAHLLKHPSVRWAQVYARPAPLVGNLPAARVVLGASGGTAEEREAELSAYLRSAFPEHAVPRFWEFLDRIPRRASFKS